MNRKRQQAEIIFRAGQLFGPVLKAADDLSGYGTDERTQVAARFFDGYTSLLEQIGIFCRGEKDHNYIVQFNRASAAILGLVQSSSNSPDGEMELFRSVRGAADIIVAQMIAVPIAADSTIFAAQTPFSTYCYVKDLCSSTAAQIVWMDRYLNQTIFHRYFTETPVTVTITLVTWPRTKCKGKNDEGRYDEFMDISKLFAQERGPQGYRLIVTEDFHDRWLRCDNKLFALGGSIKDIGKGASFTISELDSTSDNIKKFDDPIAGGTEMFGPNQTTHL